MTDTIIFDCPGYTIYEPYEGRKFRHGEVIAIPYTSRRGDQLWSFYTLGNVWGYFVNSGDDVETGVALARERGDELYWANQNGTTISSPPQAKERRPGFQFGDIIKFAGRRFLLTSTPNGNCGLVEQGEVA